MAGILDQMMAGTGLDLKNNMAIKNNDLEIVLDAAKLKAILGKDPRFADSVDLTIEGNQVKIKFKLLG